MFLLARKASRVSAWIISGGVTFSVNKKLVANPRDCEVLHLHTLSCADGSRYAFQRNGHAPNASRCTSSRRWLICDA